MMDVVELNLTQIVNTDRDGNEIKDAKGIKSYLRDNASALYQLMETWQQELNFILSRS